jgi:hypothetical protein
MTRSRDVADTQDNLGGAVAPYVGAKNSIINGAFDIWQRGTSLSGYVYTSDRWLAYQAAAVNTISRQSAGLTGFQYCARVQRNSGSTNTGATYLVQPVESSNSYQFANKIATLSFYARAGANFSASGSNLNTNIETSTGVDQSFIAAWTGSVSITGSKTLTTSWQLFTVTGLVPSTANQVAVNFNYTPVGTAGANDYFEVTAVQLELGAAATPFARAGGSIGGELALCKRYYQRYSGTIGIGLNGICYQSTGLIMQYTLPTEMRAIPSAATSGQLNISDQYLTDPIATSATLGVQGATTMGGRAVINGFTAGTLTVGRYYSAPGTNAGGGYTEFSAEL